MYDKLYSKDMAFEFDERKSLSNKEKHGIDFVEAQILWKDEHRLEVPARTVTESRFVVIGEVKSKVWAAVVTYRDENTRIISVRRARKREVELYESDRI
ncbi:MAG: BrnT family toxin [Cyanobacteria bacterium J06627_28]